MAEVRTCETEATLEPLKLMQGPEIMRGDK
jgi:hypothetical protein